MARADFRREYGLSAAEIDELSANEFIELVAGLSAGSRIREYIAAASVEEEEARIRTTQELLDGLSRHQGRVNIVEV